MYKINTGYKTLIPTMAVSILLNAASPAISKAGSADLENKVQEQCAEWHPERGEYLQPGCASDGIEIKPELYVDAGKADLPASNPAKAWPQRWHPDSAKGFGKVTESLGYSFEEKVLGVIKGLYNNVILAYKGDAKHPGAQSYGPVIGGLVTVVVGPIMLAGETAESKVTAPQTIVDKYKDGKPVEATIDLVVEGAGDAAIATQGFKGSKQTRVIDPETGACIGGCGD